MYILPFLLTTLHPSHMVLTEARTFMPRASTMLAEGAAERAWCGWWRWVWGSDAGLTRESRGRVEASSARNMMGEGGLKLVLSKVKLSVCCRRGRQRPARSLEFPHMDFRHEEVA